MRLIRPLAALAATLTYALIVLGAVVRSTGSGISCPDWPTCYGHWVLTPASFAALPPTGYAYWQVMLEWVHRLVAGFFLGPLILALVVTCLWNRRRVPGLGRAAVLLVVLLLGQALLGGITVLDQNSPWSVALHLSTALLLLTTLLWIVVSSARVPASGAVRPPLLVPMAGLAWVLALLAMAAAAMTAKSGASLACATWPTCNGAVIPDLADPLVRIHFAHRVLAAGVALAVLLVFVLTRRAEPRVRSLAATAFLLVLCEVMLGALVIATQVPIALAVVHQAVGVLTFAAITGLLWAAVPGGRQATAPPTSSGRQDELALQGA